MSDPAIVAAGANLDRFGGMLRCESCGHTEPMNPGDAGTYVASGWPKCHGYTMRWWTRRQLDAGEHESGQAGS